MMMIRRGLVLLFLLTLASRATSPRDELMERWNSFAKDANSYVAGLNRGVVDLRMRKKLTREWDALVRCECW